MKIDRKKEVHVARILLVKALIFFRIRVAGTRIPYLWLFLPTLLRIAPFAIIVANLAESEKGLSFIQIVLITTPCATLIRRLFRITAMSKRIPSWIEKSNDSANSLLAFTILTIFENFPALLIITIAIALWPSAGIITATYFFVSTSMMLFLACMVIVLSSPAILNLNKKYEDVRYGTRYSETIINGLFMAIIGFDLYENWIICLIPGTLFPIITQYQYGEIKLFLIAISCLPLVIIVTFCHIKYPLSSLNTFDTDLDDLKFEN